MRLPIARAALAALCLYLLPGCSLFNQKSTDDGGAPAMTGFGAPTLEVTINGVHFGPAAPDSGSSATLISSFNSQTGRLASSSLHVNASSSAGNGACALGVSRQGDDVQPIGVGGWTLQADSFGPTPDGLVDPIAGESVSVPQGTWGCSGNGCTGAGLVISAMDATHIEGYLAGTFANTAGGAAADVVCAFYLPLTGAN